MTDTPDTSAEADPVVWFDRPVGIVVHEGGVVVFDALRVPIWAYINPLAAERDALRAEVARLREAAPAPQVANSVSLRAAIDALRSIPVDWPDDPLGEAGELNDEAPVKPLDSARLAVAEAEVARLREALHLMQRVIEVRSELFVGDGHCLMNISDRIALALAQKGEAHE